MYVYCLPESSNRTASPRYGTNSLLTINPGVSYTYMQREEEREKKEEEREIGRVKERREKLKTN